MLLETIDIEVLTHRAPTVFPRDRNTNQERVSAVHVEVIFISLFYTLKDTLKRTQTTSYFSDKTLKLRPVVFLKSGKALNLFPKLKGGI